MYRLTLTAEERRAFDWIGDRYETGGPVARMLSDYMPEAAEWDGPDDITFTVPEHVAWQIDQASKAEGHYWPCFSPDLAKKMCRFTNQLV